MVGSSRCDDRTPQRGVPTSAFAGNCLVILSKLPLVIPSEVEEFLTIVQADCVSAWNYLEKAAR
jgi:hypothetical protein